MPAGPRFARIKSLEFNATRGREGRRTSNWVAVGYGAASDRMNRGAVYSTLNGLVTSYISALTTECVCSASIHPTWEHI